jgi:hypothetical protein
LFIFVLWHTLSNGKTGEKDNFHNLFFGLTKNPISISLKPTILKDFLFPRGGGGWRKTFKISKINILDPSQEFRPASLSDLFKGYFKGLPQEKISSEFNPDPDR